MLQCRLLVKIKTKLYSFCLFIKVRKCLKNILNSQVFMNHADTVRFIIYLYQLSLIFFCYVSVLFRLCQVYCTHHLCTTKLFNPLKFVFFVLFCLVFLILIYTDLVSSPQVCNCRWKCHLSN